MEKITIAIPIYNVETYVERALNSALNQTYPNIEILAIDDKGSDNSMDVVRRVQKEHPKGDLIRIIEHEQNRGTGATRNTGIDEATGEYLMYLDSDDEMMANCVGIHYKYIKEFDTDYTYGARYNVNSIGEYFETNLSPQVQLLLDGYDEVKNYYFSGEYRTVVTWNKLYKLAFLKEYNIRCIDNQRSEDFVFSYQVWLNAKRVLLFPEVTYLYSEYREGSLVDKFRNGEGVHQFLSEIYDTSIFQLKYAEKYKNIKQYKRIINYPCYRFISILCQFQQYIIGEDKKFALKIYNKLSLNSDAKTRFKMYLLLNHNYIYNTIRIVYKLLSYSCWRRFILKLVKNN